jgi:hypothetical protein
VVSMRVPYLNLVMIHRFVKRCSLSLCQIFRSHGEFCASQPWEVIVATLTFLVCILTVWGRHSEHAWHTTSSNLTASSPAAGQAAPVSIAADPDPVPFCIITALTSGIRNLFDPGSWIRCLFVPSLPLLPLFPFLFFSKATVPRHNINLSTFLYRITALASSLFVPFSKAPSS